jgi:N-acetyl-anhydromuramyl-L-alanine amidase AmpD
MINRIVWHWAVTGYNITSHAKNAYHFLIDGEGVIHEGKFSVSDNASGKPLVTGKYAAHTRGLNTGSIGNSVLSMVGAIEVPFSTGPCPMKENQIEALLHLTAMQVKQYNIPVSGRNLLSHAEVEPTLGIKQAGKWDYMWLPGLDFPKNPVIVGNILRDRLDKMLTGWKPSLQLTARASVRRGSRGEDVADLQTALSLKADGVFGPATENAVKAFQKSKQLLPDGIVGPVTWAALNL